MLAEEEDRGAHALDYKALYSEKNTINVMVNVVLCSHLSRSRSSEAFTCWPVVKKSSL